MISFRHRTNSKRIKIRTNKRLDERMSAWLQKVFAIKNQIIGFKHDNKYYDVETFYLLIDKFYNSQVDIVEGTDQIQISFTSDNLNSSSFIRPSQPTSEINQKAASSQSADEIVFVPDLKAFQARLTEGRDVSVCFDIHPGFRKEIVESMAELNSVPGAKAGIYVIINNSAPKKSNFSIYVGRTCVVMIPLTSQYRSILQGILSRWRKGEKTDHGRAVKQVQDEAPSFTTYHLQQRLNQQACLDYLGRMNVDRLLSNYEYHKLVEKLQDNFNDFYKIFCEGVIDNDYDSFKNQIRSKVENNLEMLLSNVEEMDLSRPISREEQRRQNLRKSVPDIEIVKVENYFEVLDLIGDRLDNRFLGEIKQRLLDEDEQICGYFAKFLSRDIGKQQLSRKLTAYAREKSEETRPISRCVPRENARAKSTECFLLKKEEVRDELDMKMEVGSGVRRAEEAPMFGSLPKEVHSASPIKNMSDIESNYKQAWDRLAKCSEFFAPEEYGLLYHYLQTHDDSISNLIQLLDKDEQGTLAQLKEFLRVKISQLMSENFSENDLAYIEANRSNPNISYIFQNFKYECEVNAFVATLKQQLAKVHPQVERVLHKKSSDSQLLDNNKKTSGKRKYSAEKNQDHKASPSPKASDISQRGSQLSLYNFKASTTPWKEEFEEMLKFCEFRQQQKLDYLREGYEQCNPSIFLWVREYIKNKESGLYTAEYFRTRIQKKQYEQKSIMKVLPLFSELMRELEQEGTITLKMRKWAVFSFMELHLPLLAAFELYLFQKDQAEFVDSLKLSFENDNKDMQFYRFYLSRIEVLLQQMSVHNEVSLQVFRAYPEKIRSIVEVFYFTGNVEDMLENLDLLQAEHVRKSKVSVASLNFSGINTNPFEYDDGSAFFQNINRNVQQLVSLEFPDLKDWKVGKIDKEYSGNRLSVGFNSELQLRDGHLLNREQFEQIWRRRYSESGIGQKLKPKEQQISTNIKMDFLFYRALIREVYQLSSFEELDKTLKSLPGARLNQFLAEKFNRPASKLNVKQDFVVEYLLKQKIDVLCLQEAGSVDWKEELMPAYAVYKNHDSVIIYSRQKFGGTRADLMKQYGPVLDFNKDTAFLFTDKNYLLISAHLKSKKEINRQQAKEMFSTLKGIRKQHPLLKIVLGMDANHFVDQSLLFDESQDQLFFLTPSVPDKPTTVKKRSFMQAQYNKAGLQVSEVKDHVVCSREIVEQGIQTITGEESSNALLPNDVHPYDHYIVYAVAKFL